MTSTARHYHAATLEGASHLGLLLATYDVLAEDIRLAGQAAERNDIEERCRLSHHANLLLGHLESWVPLLEEPVLQASLISFYNLLRVELLQLQQTAARQGFEDLALTICEMRAVWQRRGYTPLAADRQPLQQIGEPTYHRPETLAAERHMWLG